MLREFKDFCLEHIPQLHNEEANRLAQHASRYQPILVVLTSTVDANEWRTEITDYLKDPSMKVGRRVRFQAAEYVLLDGELYYHTLDGVLLKCLGNDESKSFIV